MENLTPGKYAVTGHADGMASLKGEVEVHVGQESELRLTLNPAALCRIAVWFQGGGTPGSSTTSIVGTDGAVFHERSWTHGAAPARPFERSVRVPLGQWTVRVTTDTGLAGDADFTVDSVGREYPVRVDCVRR